MPNSGQPTIVPGVGFQNSAAGLELGFYASRSCSLMRPPRTGRRFIRSGERSAAGWSGRGGWSWRLRWGTASKLVAYCLTCGFVEFAHAAL